MTIPRPEPTAFNAAAIDQHPRTSVIEASAGTGKTTAIAVLTTRALALGWCTCEQLMLVTFGSRATTELRTRLHERLTRSIAQLRDPGLATGPHDDLVIGDGSDRADRLERLETALRDIDRATIATTHGFCQSMLAELGVLVDHDPRSGFRDDLQDLTEQVLSDSYLRHQSTEPTGLYLSTARTIAQLVVARQEPLRGPAGTPADRWLLATDVRRWVERRKRVLGVHSFDDMVGRLHRALRAELPEDSLPPGSNALLARRTLSRRFRWVMIDEYQDTDSQQWEIARAAFDGHSRLLLIGDPKQAIYAFRGADVHAYLRALDDSHDTSTMSVNWRSSFTVVEAVSALFDGFALGRGITLPRVTAHRPDHQLLGDGGPLPLVQLRLVTGAADRPMAEHEAELAITRDLVAEVGRLLRCRLADPKSQTGESVGRRVAPSDITVLVRTNRRGEQLRDALLTSGVQAVFSGSGSVFASRAARDWLRLLDAIDQPTPSTIRKAALTSFFGHDVMSLSRLDEGGVADIALAIKEIGRLLGTTGVAAAFTELCEQREVLARVLADPQGERVVTDLRHLGHLLHDHQRRTGCGVTGLVEWLSEHVHQRGDSDEGTRRLESDRAAVQILTIHRAKGLDLPIVLVAEAATYATREPHKHHPVVVHDDQRRGWIVLQPDEDARGDAAREEADEELRLLYVALTRASHVLRVWWAPSGARTPRSALHRVLADTGPRLGSPPAQLVPLAERPAAALLQRWANTTWQPVHVADPSPPPLDAVPTSTSLTVEVRRFSRSIDPHWRRTSYSALTSGLHDIPPAGLVTDEPDLGDPVPGEDEVAGPPDSEPMVSPMSAFPGGVLFGTLVHAVLEDLDPHRPDLADELRRASARALAATPIAGVDQESLVEGLELVVSTPLGPLAGGRSLRDYPGTDRLAELDFELPLSQDSTRATTVADLATALTNHLPRQDPLSDYGRRLAETPAAAQVLAGWLTGSIDAVLRHREADGPRHLVVDYKTNRMPLPPGRELTIQHYSSAAMAEAMMASHYPLQALLYCVALHRHLTHRMPGYDPTRHLGGVGYLFVRGMAGDRGHQPADMPWGVFTWLPPTALVLVASEILGGRG